MFVRPPAPWSRCSLSSQKRNGMASACRPTIFPHPPTAHLCWAWGVRPWAGLFPGTQIQPGADGSEHRPCTQLVAWVWGRGDGSRKCGFTIKTLTPKWQQQGPLPRVGMGVEERGGGTCGRDGHWPGGRGGPDARAAVVQAWSETQRCGPSWVGAMGTGT